MDGLREIVELATGEKVRMEKMTHSVVPYQTPHARAIQATGVAALGFLASFAVVGVPVVVEYLNKQAASAKSALEVVAYTLGALFLGLVATYAASYIRANGSNIPPTVDPVANAASAPVRHMEFGPFEGHTDFATAEPVQATAGLVSLPALPMVDPELLVDLVNESLATYLRAKKKVDSKPAAPVDPPTYTPTDEAILRPAAKNTKRPPVVVTTTATTP
jgi:hypothetical protein